MLTLDKLTIGQHGSVVSIDPNASLLRQKLLAMGLTPGAPVHVLRFSPFGDPMIIKVRGTVLSLRKAEAQSINLELAV
ncbi:ferrous iron transport protein A [Pseudoalteromonas sp. NEC-BIFX-2020_002]|uniref:FeoA family protein n=1 Tax=Pseudoalteromonas neustonica TaxID=1840331 RepID=A0ABU9U4E5_9GAMM|nr:MULTISPECIES: FeoA family protein [Pseudoalteromonas]NMR27651.1 ferrous iron transport protein A [Pseudoalteromonas sp. NEC-BIFX-2020_015]NNG41362.1 ferrous iron transport protein A [Pseudoalteromonas sp. NEC-BIFX-2020_002]